MELLRIYMKQQIATLCFDRRCIMCKASYLVNSNVEAHIRPNLTIKKTALTKGKTCKKKQLAAADKSSQLQNEIM
jgi:hypothetical protein